MRNTISFLTIVLGLGLALALPSTGSAAYQTGSLRHAYKPYVVGNTWTTRARINNVSPMWQSGLVCVQAKRLATGKMYHLGCLNLSLASAWSEGMWGVEFDAPTYWLTRPGSYTVMYTYQGVNGNWYPIRSMSGMATNGHFVVN